MHITVSSGEKISFTRQHNDDRLDETIRKLQSEGEKIIDIETERATLLDVLERYEAEMNTDKHGLRTTNVYTAYL